jgi:potassium efflux system protein
VSRIQIRATTLVDFNRKEVLVPNKTFITNEVINWTLTSATNRLLIPVGVAYGTDTEKALQLLAEVAAAHPRILKDPEPVGTFENFGDNTLNLVLRCYIDRLQGRFSVISDLNVGIDAAYRKAGISIAFPQRDVHLDTSSPLDIRMLRAKPATDVGEGGSKDADNQNQKDGKFEQ